MYKQSAEISFGFTFKTPPIWRWHRANPNTEV